jgi:hypothetical protein
MSSIGASIGASEWGRNYGDVDYFTCSPDERRLQEAYSACRLVEEHKKQLQEQVWQLSRDFVDARTLCILKEKEVREWQQKHAQLQQQHAQLQQQHAQVVLAAAWGGMS